MSEPLAVQVLAGRLKCINQHMLLCLIARHDVSRGFFDFVTCPCSFRTKRHDNLFVYDDDEDACGRPQFTQPQFNTYTGCSIKSSSHPIIFCSFLRNCLEFQCNIHTSQLFSHHIQRANLTSFDNMLYCQMRSN